MAISRFLLCAAMSYDYLSKIMGLRNPQIHEFLMATFLGFVFIFGRSSITNIL